MAPYNPQTYQVDFNPIEDSKKTKVLMMRISSQC